MDKKEIILDTETTGLDPQYGHRIIEIGALEMHNKVLTGKKFHFYIILLNSQVSRDEK
jgi:DNA polymerase-3 subunit epsilon